MLWRLVLTRLYEKAGGRRVNDDPSRGLALYRQNLWVPDLTVMPVDGGHWWPATHPKELAKLVRAS